MIPLKSILLLALALVLLGSASAAEATRPNIILILSDDHGYTDYGFMGNEAVRTPHLDRLASQSKLYTRGYVMPVCSPSLASLLTGLYPHQHGITGNDVAGSRKADRNPLAKRLLSNPLMLPKTLSDAGYLTLQTGKLWNVTYQDVGFTHGMTDTASRHGDAGLDIGRKGMKPVFDFIDEAVAEEKPFFIWYAPFLPHTPHNPPKELLARYKGKGPTPAAEKYHAMVEWLDNTCGEIDGYLEKKKIIDNTVVLYLADNGWDAAKGQDTTRAKLSPYEMGIRTPMFVRWPGKVEPSRDGETLASIVDFAPTILKLAGAEAPAGLPGLNLLDDDAMKSRQSIFVESYTHDIADLSTPAKSLMSQIVIDGWSKLLIPGPARPDKPHASRPDTVELFDLKADPKETTNLASEKPEEVARLREIQQAFWATP